MPGSKLPRHACTAVVSAAFVIIINTAASAQLLSNDAIGRDNAALRQGEPQFAVGPALDDAELAPALRRQVIAYGGDEPRGTVVIDTAHAFLYLTLGGGKALRYGIGVGRKGFTWSGVETISRKSEWPDWIPPAEMIARQPYLPRWVSGGPGNPLGARALYLGHTDYRIHGTNNPASIGKHVSSGCIRMFDADVIDLYSRVGIGTKVMVLANNQHAPVGGAERVAVEGMPGAMDARISVQPAIAVVDRPRARAEWSSNPAAFGLY